MTPDLPPPIYDHQYSGRILVVERVEPKDVHDRCKDMGAVVPPMHSIMGCAHVLPNGVCRVVLPKDYGFSREFMERLWRHEIGHCNGWRHP